MQVGIHIHSNISLDFFLKTACSAAPLILSILSLSAPESFTLWETVHVGDFCQNTVACAGAQAQRLEVNILGAHSGDEFANVIFDGVWGRWIDGRIENLVKPEDIVLVFLDRLAVDLFTMPCTFCQVQPCSRLQGNELRGTHYRHP